MNNIIDFPKFKTEKELYPKELKDILMTLPQELRDEVREAIEIPISKYKPLILEDINISIPNETNEEQKIEIQKVILEQRQAILELVQKLVLTRVNSVLDKYSNS